MTKRTTIYDIAKALQITPSTVSRALNNHSYISEATKKLIKKKAVEMNYKLNTHAHNLRTGGSKTLGVIVPKINMTFFSNVIAG
ncbi:MAG: LacI family DNA-binding transcriptional regulator, partial [Pedobacter sp.]|nr:LacI family DNA-binding transcriptional regulator [Chitinophagaceae bacterium]